MKRSERYHNRELSWLDFNQRVLSEAQCEANPLLERIKFLAITASNLDEFFRVRVGGLKFLAKIGNTEKRAICGRDVPEQLSAIEKRTQQFFADQYATLAELESLLSAQQITRCTPSQLSREQLNHLKRRFRSEFFDAITSVAVREEMPLLIGASLGLLVRLSTDSLGVESDDKYQLAILPVARNLERIVSIPSKDGFRYVMLEDVVAEFIDDYFPDGSVEEMCFVRIVRNADFTVDDDASSDLLSDMTEALEARKTGDCVSLQTDRNASQEMIENVCSRLGVAKNEVYLADGPLDLSAYFSVAGAPGFGELKDESWPPVPCPSLQTSGNMFDAISERDHLLVHPYQSFDQVVALIEAAADDPDVIAIKQTLYRTSKNSPIVAALARAAENGKNVTVIVEVKARFDEARNITWARKLELSGVDVIYGVSRLKTHAKNCVIVRREPEGIRRYFHVGTGNYNEATARLYGDISLLSCDEQLGADCIAFFNAVCGFSIPQPMQKLIAAPLELKNKILDHIATEIENHVNGLPSGITAKLNSLTDQQVIDALYEASQAGVVVRLNIRGICCLRAGVPGLSENITVCSIIDRFLEHARIIHFVSGGDSRIYISSADWMERNLRKRVELLAPVEAEHCSRPLLQMLEAFFRDNCKSHIMQPDGSYYRRSPGSEKAFRSQQWHYQYATHLRTEADSAKSTAFIPQRGDLER